MSFQKNISAFIVIGTYIYGAGMLCVWLAEMLHWIPAVFVGFVLVVVFADFWERPVE
jgi:CHASE2 domain-containing sensor protein